MPINANIDTRELERVAKTVLHGIKNGVPRVMTPAINRALESGRTTVKREIRKHYLIKAKDIPVTIHRATRGSTQSQGDIVLKDHMLDLGKFKISPSKLLKRRRVIRAQVKVGGGGPLPGAFHTPLTYPGPFVRKGHARLPIRKLLAISAPIMASQANVGPAVNTQMGDTLAQRFDHELERVLATAGGGHP
jgi:hypothetical protein